MVPLYPSTSLANETIATDLPQVKGVEGAKAYPTKINARDAVWDADENYIYVRRTNVQGQITVLERYRYEADPIPTMEEVFATKNDLNSLKGEISDVKQSIQELVSAIKSIPAAPAAVGQAQSNEQHNGYGKSGKGKSQYNGTADQQQS